jgi:uncharacterized membrane protein
VAATLPTGRLEAFSDGVFAIAITLLVLEISVPEGSGDDLLEAILDQWPSYLAYVVSFATIGATWLAHNTMTELLHRADSVLLRLNLLLLMLVSFVPFPTSLVAEHIHERNAERVATTILGLNLLAIAILVSVMWRYALRGEHARLDPDDEEVQVLTRRLTPGLAGYVAFIALGLVAPIAAVIGYLLIALALLFPIGLGGSGSSTET